MLSNNRENENELISAGRLGCLFVFTRMKVCGLPLFTVLSVFSHSGSTAGFIIPESSVEGVALSDAMVANSSLPGAFTYNYSSMIFADSDQASIDLIGVSLDTSVAPLSPNSETGKQNNQASNALIPAFYIFQSLSSNYSWGLHFGVPFGLESVWPEDTFTYFQDVDTATGAGGAVAGLHPAQSRLELVTLSPSLAKKINQQFAVALGFDYYHLMDAELNSVANQVSGDGSELGWNLSFQYHLNQWSFGASYHSAIDMQITGNANIAGVGSVGTKTSLGLPDRLQIGTGYQFNEQWFVELDIERIGWSEYDQLQLTSTGGAIPATTVFSVNTNNWSDVTNVRLGMSYKIRNNTQLLFGAAFEEKAQGDDYFDAATADADRYMLSFGVLYQLTSEWILKAGYQYARIEERNIEGKDYLDQLVLTGGVNSDANGTNAYNGQYEGYIQMLAVGISRTL